MTEAKYVCAGKPCQQALWMKQALIDYDICLDEVPIMCDNKGAIDLISLSSRQHPKGNISIEKVASEDNPADILTKPLKREVFNYLRLGLGMMNSSWIVILHPPNNNRKWRSNEVINRYSKDVNSHYTFQLQTSDHEHNRD
ncbi:hypothetical protein Tco_0199732 [Tanacetum coccineum]